MIIVIEDILNRHAHKSNLIIVIMSAEAWSSLLGQGFHLLLPTFTVRIHIALKLLLEAFDDVLVVFGL